MENNKQNWDYMSIDRPSRLLEMLRKENIKAAIVHKQENVRYLSGYRGEGVLVLTEDGKRVIVTDFRYTEQAEKEAPSFSVVMSKATQSYDEVALDLLGEAGESRLLAFEDDTITVAQMKKLEEKANGRIFLPMNKKIEKLREIKDDGETAAIEKACEIACQAFESILPKIQPGKTEREIAWILECAMHDFGAQKPSFSTIIASGSNGSLPHAIPSDKKLERGEFVTLDFGCVYDGYCSDCTRTVALGEVSEEQLKIYNTVLTAQLASLDAVRDGAGAKAVDKIARDIINEAGYEGRFGHGLGHSLGLEIHENPRFSQSMEDSRTVSAGMLMTVEPGIYIPGKWGVRIEDTVLVTKNGSKRLTHTTKELIVL
ncbi:MAG: Xaa-Pro peptidase family protein [Oscillospiraceae bacterium]|jgi:Xaa-Pro aminopeptidase|nr:Xaa-Pro peptidase family protein [Oscillospiraceae bacterium]